MLLVKGLLSLCIVFFGYKFSHKFTKKTDFLKDLHTFTLRYIDCLQFYKINLYQILEENANYKPEFCEFLREYKEFLTSGERDILSLFDYKVEQKNKAVIASFFENLGKSNAEAELQKSMDYKQIFANQLAESQSLSNKNTPLYFKLSIYLSILVFILII